MNIRFLKIIKQVVLQWLLLGAYSGSILIKSSDFLPYLQKKQSPIGINITRNVTLEIEYPRHPLIE